MGSGHDTNYIISAIKKFLAKCHSATHEFQVSAVCSIVFNSDNYGTKFILYVVFIMCAQGNNWWL
jgi:hypothetical protein